MLNYQCSSLIIFIILAEVSFLWNNAEGSAWKCDHTPEETTGPKSKADDRFKIEISGNPLTYVPGEMYTVRLTGVGRGAAAAKFIGFYLFAEPSSRNGVGSPGKLHLYGDAMVRDMNSCPNTIMHTSLLPKTDVQVLWTAPAQGTGCVIFRATVIERTDLWYQDEGSLSKTICEDLKQNSDEQPEVNQQCCACDEAKYEVIFEALWSRQTHPKDFPENHQTRFSDVIGASHTTDYRFWAYGGKASEGLRQVAELGSTKMIESELKNQSEYIRTIIKARGITYPNVTSKTFAVFRVDNKHHLISLVSMIDPSPDWIVGVSGYELCLSNCSWLESKILNLYPYDVGTDSGITYTSPDQPTEPRDHIRRITTSFPADPSSPFYDPSGQEMKPLGRLHLSRQRLYEKSCADVNFEYSRNEDEDESSPFGGIKPESHIRPLDFSHTSGVDGRVLDCKVSAWTSWSECTVSCGRGLRQRSRQIVTNASNGGRPCPTKLLKRKKCNMGPCTTGFLQDDNQNYDYEEENENDCIYSEWSKWSSCSSSCNHSFQQRERIGENKVTRLPCKSRIETRVCNVPPCNA